MNKPFVTASRGGATGIPNDPQPDDQAEQVLTDRMASLGRLVAGLAHEMNNPLASVLANLELALVDVGELIQNEASADRLETLREELRHARDAAERVRQLLHDVRMFSRAEDAEPTPVDVADILDTSLRIARNAIRYRARIVKDYEQVSPVLATETGLAQAFLNIVTAATSAIEEGDLDSNEIHVGIRNEQGQVVVEIGHTGQASPRGPSVSPTVPPHSTRAELSPSIPISQRLVSGFGGNLEVLDPAGSGVAFRVSLPPIESRAAARPAVFPSARAVRRGRVLIVVEEAMSAKAIRRALEKEHDVTVLETAKGALEQISAGQRFDVILCDLMMPNMSGMDLYDELVRQAPDQATSMVFITSRTPNPKAHEFLQATMNQQLEKPFDNAQLRTLVRRRLS